MGLLEKLKAGKRNVKILKFPGTDEDIGLTVLTDAEMQQAVFDADRHFKKEGIEIGAGTLGAHQAELNIQVLSRAIVDPATGKTIFPTAARLREMITRDVRDLLIEEYNSFEQECSPSPLNMNDDDFLALFEDLKKNAAPTNGSGLNSRTQKGLTSFLVRRATISPKGSGSTS